MILQTFEFASGSDDPLPATTSNVSESGNIGLQSIIGKPMVFSLVMEYYLIMKVREEVRLLLLEK